MAFFSAGRLKLSKFGISKQAAGNRGFSESLGEREGCVVNHALWWVINCLYNHISCLIIVLKAGVNSGFPLRAAHTDAGACAG